MMRGILALAAATSLAAGGALSTPRPAAALDLGQWIQNPATGHWYTEAAPMPWPDAEAWAIGLGGHLVTINDLAEETWLEATFPETVWIGMNDVAVEGTWVWSSGEPVTYTKWIPGQPDNWEIIPEGEDYAVMNWTFAGAFGWDDWDGASNSAVVELAGPPATGTLTVTASTTLTADHSGNIVIASNGITLDCAGHTVYGAGVGSGILLDGRSGVTVRNCAVTGFERGFELSGSSGNRLEHNTATHNNASYGQGFFLAFGSNANIVERNTANENGAGDPASGMEGFRVENSRDNVLRDNVANLNATWGFIVVGYDADASGNTLDGNTANDNAFFGFTLATRAVGNTLTGNTADGNGNTGFLVQANDGSNTFRNNRAANNLYNGFNDSNSPGNTFVGNVADRNGATGFSADRASGLVFTRNSASANLDGFVILLVDSSRFAMNTADHNGRNGFAALNSASDVFSGNVVKGNGENGNGFVFLGSRDMWVENNAAEDVFGAGFSLGSFDGPGTSATTLVGNTATACGSGFGLDLATGNTLKNNKASSNAAGPGFALGPGADSNILSGNSAIDNVDGFLLWSWADGGPAPSYNLLTANVANRNEANGFAVQTGASHNSFVRNVAHANGDWDAIQNSDAGPGNLWVGNKFGKTAGF